MEPDFPRIYALPLAMYYQWSMYYHGLCNMDPFGWRRAQIWQPKHANNRASGAFGPHLDTIGAQGVHVGVPLGARPDLGTSRAKVL